MSPAGRHSHKVRELKRRIDAVVAEEQERRQLPSPPISAEHAAMGKRIEFDIAELERQLPDGMISVRPSVRQSVKTRTSPTTP